MGELPNAAVGFPTLLLTTAPVVVVGWVLSLSGAVLLDTAAPGALPPLLSMLLLLLLLTPFVPWRVTRRLVRPIAALFPDEPGPSREDIADLT